VPEALIFDVDGTLAETEELHRRAFNETFAEAGLPWHWGRDDYRRLLTTTGGKERIARHLAEAGGPAADIAALHAAKTRRYARLVAAGDLALRPGIAALMEGARAAGLRLAVATTTSRPNVEALAQAIWRRPAGAVFDAIAAGDEVAAKKPAPDVYLLALARLGLPAAACVAFEDTRNGLLSARGAGIACLVVPSVYSEGEDFAGALAVSASHAEVGGLAGIAALLDGRTA
jgi:HAD superfamily hydrolase (TIGR01509 family)